MFLLVVVVSLVDHGSRHDGAVRPAIVPRAPTPALQERISLREMKPLPAFVGVRHPEEAPAVAAMGLLALGAKLVAPGQPDPAPVPPAARRRRAATPTGRARRA